MVKPLYYMYPQEYRSILFLGWQGTNFDHGCAKYTFHPQNLNFIASRNLIDYKNKHRNNIIWLLQLLYSFFLKTMESFDESNVDELSDEQSICILNLEKSEELKDEAGLYDNSASIKNPNKDDSRRLFQVHKMDLVWDPTKPYDQLPDRLEQDGPVPLDFPAHFYDVEGGISVIYWDEDRSTGCLCSILGVNEVDRTFKFQALSWQGRKKKTFFDTGRTIKAKESSVWRLVHRMEFERPIKKDGLRVGQTLRILLKNQFTDFTGFVLERRKQWVRVRPTESKSDDDNEFKLSDIVSATEIMYSPLFYRLRQFVAGERVGKKNISWKACGESKECPDDPPTKPKMLLHAPPGCTHKRAWHF